MHARHDPDVRGGERRRCAVAPDDGEAVDRDIGAGDGQRARVGRTCLELDGGDVAAVLGLEASGTW